MMDFIAGHVLHPGYVPDPQLWLRPQELYPRVSMPVNLLTTPKCLHCLPVKQKNQFGQDDTHLEIRQIFAQTSPRANKKWFRCFENVVGIPLFK